MIRRVRSLADHSRRWVVGPTTSQSNRLIDEVRTTTGTELVASAELRHARIRLTLVCLMRVAKISQPLYLVRSRFQDSGSVHICPSVHPAGRRPSSVDGCIS
jgi:hypothetical protein